LNTVLYPLEVCKIHQQIDRSLSLASLYATISHIYQSDGVTGFYKGYSLALLQGWINDFLVKQFNSLATAITKAPVAPIAAAGHQLLAHTITYPLITLKSRFIVSPVKSPRAHLRDVIQIATDDPGAFFRGLPTSMAEGIARLSCLRLLKFIPADWIAFIIDNEFVFFTFLPLLEVAAEAIAYPFETISRQMDVQNLHLPKHANLTAFPYTTSTKSFGVVKQAVEQRGVLSLWTGLGTSALSITLCHSMIAAYIYAKDALLGIVGEARQ